MRRFATLAALAAAACLTTAPASAEMTKCVAPDGTVAYQAKPCAVASGYGGAAVAANREGAERAVSDREATQRRDRCRAAKEIADRQRALLASDAAVDRKATNDEIAIQDRRMRQDNCGAM